MSYLDTAPIIQIQVGSLEMQSMYAEVGTALYSSELVCRYVSAFKSTAAILEPPSHTKMCITKALKARGTLGLFKVSRMSDDCIAALGGY